MAVLTTEDILKLAHLARLGVTDDEVEHYKTELNAIIGYVDLLADVDVEGLAPTSQVTGLTNVTRADEVKHYGYDTDALLALAPASQDGLIKVKRMIG